MGRRRPTPPDPSGVPKTLHGSFAEAEIDLHGLREHEALGRVDAFLDRYGSRPGAVVRIITGKGARSAGRSVLLDAVGELLRSEVGHRLDDVALDRGGGAWLARIAG